MSVFCKLRVKCSPYTKPIAHVYGRHAIVDSIKSCLCNLLIYLLYFFSFKYDLNYLIL